MFPVVRRQDKCHPYKPYIMCAMRRDAEMHNEFYWHPELRGYVATDFPKREVSWRTRYYHKDIENTTGDFYVLERCPWCSMPLPDIQGIADATCASDEEE